MNKYAISPSLRSPWLLYKKKTPKLSSLLKATQQENSLNGDDFFSPLHLTDEIDNPNRPSDATSFSFRKSNNETDFYQLLADYHHDDGGLCYNYFVSVLYFPSARVALPHICGTVSNGGVDPHFEEPFSLQLQIYNRFNRGIIKFSAPYYNIVNIDDMSYLGNYLHANAITYEWSSREFQNSLNLLDDLFAGCKINYYKNSIEDPPNFSDWVLWAKQQDAITANGWKWNKIFLEQGGHTGNSIRMFINRYDSLQRLAFQKSLIPSIEFSHAPSDNINPLTGLPVDNGIFQDPLAGDVDLSGFATTAGFIAITFNNWFINIPAKTKVEQRISNIIIREIQNISYLILTFPKPTLLNWEKLPLNLDLGDRLIVYPTKGKTQYKVPDSSSTPAPEEIREIARANIKNIISFMRKTVKIQIYPYELTDAEMRYIHGFSTEAEFIASMLNPANNPEYSVSNEGAHIASDSSIEEAAIEVEEKLESTVDQNERSALQVALHFLYRLIGREPPHEGLPHADPGVY